MYEGTPHAASEVVKYSDGNRIDVKKRVNLKSGERGLPNPEQVEGDRWVLEWSVFCPLILALKYKVLVRKMAIFEFFADPACWVPQGPNGSFTNVFVFVRFSCYSHSDSNTPLPGANLVHNPIIHDHLMHFLRCCSFAIETQLRNHTRTRYAFSDPQITTSSAKMTISQGQV